MDQPPTDRRIRNLAYMQAAARGLSLQDLDRRVGGRGDLASLLSGRLRGAFARRRAPRSGALAGTGWRDRTWSLCSGGCLALGREALVSTATFLRVRRLFVLAASALAMGACARVAVGPRFFFRLLRIPVVAVAL